MMTAASIYKVMIVRFCSMANALDDPVDLFDLD